jgi:hypothetical protein
VCVICDGGSFEEMLSGEFVRIAVHGFTMISVESATPWTYTIGLVRSFEHPELVVTGLPTVGAELITDVVDRIREGERFDASSPRLSLCDCMSVAFGAVHPGQWSRGRFDQWLRYYEWLGQEPPAPDAVQVVWPDSAGRFPPDPTFCGLHVGDCQPLLDGAPRHNVNIGSNRQQRRRARYGHGKRRRR